MPVLMITTVVALTGTPTERHIVSGSNAKQTAQLIAAHTGQEAIWTGKVMAEWHITDRRSRKVSAIVREG
jgi:hypothetical protein